MLKSESMGWPIRASWMLLISVQFLPVYISSYAILILLLLIGWHWKSNDWQALGKNTWFKLLLTYFCWQIFTLFWTENFTDAGSNLSTQLLLVLLPALLFVRKPNLTDIQWLLKAQYFASLLAVIFALAYGVWRVYQTSVINENVIVSYLFYTGLSSPIMHPGYFSLQLIVSLGILAKFLADKYWRFNVWTISTGLIILLCLIMLNGRMTVLSALVTLGLGLIYQAVINKRWLPVYALAGVILILFLGVKLSPTAIQDRFLELTESFDYDIATFRPADYNGVTGRLAIWECSGEIIRDNFWLGTGAGDGKAELRSVYAKNGFLPGLHDQLNSHNQFIEAMIYGGLVQSLLLLGLFVYGIRKGLTNNNPMFAAFLVFIFLCLQTETVLFWHTGVLYFSLFASIFYLLNQNPKRAVK